MNNTDEFAITDEQITANKQSFSDALNAISLDEVAIHKTLKTYTDTSRINAIFLCIFAVSTFAYPLVQKGVNPFFYVAFWAASLSIYVLRIKHSLKIITKELELVGLINLKALYENEFEKLRQIEYDRLTRKTSVKGDGPAIQGNGVPAPGDREDSGSPEKKNGPGPSESPSSESAGSPTA